MESTVICDENAGIHIDPLRQDTWNGKRFRDMEKIFAKFLLATELQEFWTGIFFASLPITVGIVMILGMMLVWYMGLALGCALSVWVWMLMMMSGVTGFSLCGMFFMYKKKREDPKSTV